jgi:hemerythrin-like metal-binding protein
LVSAAAPEHRNQKTNRDSMAYFSWNDGFSVGSEFIDNDHRKLIDLVNDLHDAMAQGKGRETLGRTLAELIEYTREHFRREEDVMQRIDYHGAASHRDAHARLINDVTELQRKFNDGGELPTAEVSKFLRDWLVNHIMRTDMAFASAIRRAERNGAKVQ